MWLVLANKFFVNSDLLSKKEFPIFGNYLAIRAIKLRFWFYSTFYLILSFNFSTLPKKCSSSLAINTLFLCKFILSCFKLDLKRISCQICQMFSQIRVLYFSSYTAKVYKIFHDIMIKINLNLNIFQPPARLI